MLFVLDLAISVSVTVLDLLPEATSQQHAREYYKALYNQHILFIVLKKSWIK